MNINIINQEYGKADEHGRIAIIIAFLKKREVTEELPTIVNDGAVSTMARYFLDIVPTNRHFVEDVVRQYLEMVNDEIKISKDSSILSYSTYDIFGVSTFQATAIAVVKSNRETFNICFNAS